jgi:hypothetical protein
MPSTSSRDMRGKATLLLAKHTTVHQQARTPAHTTVHTFPWSGDLPSDAVTVPVVFARSRRMEGKAGCRR